MNYNSDIKYYDRMFFEILWKIKPFLIGHAPYQEMRRYISFCVVCGPRMISFLQYGMT